MNEHIITLLDTLSLIVQYFGVGIITTSFVELIKEPFKKWFPLHHDKVLILLSGLIGLILQGFAFGWVPQILLEGFVVGTAVSGGYRIGKGFINPVKLQIEPKQD